MYMVAITGSGVGWSQKSIMALDVLFVIMTIVTVSVQVSHILSQVTERLNAATVPYDARHAHSTKQVVTRP